MSWSPAALCLSWTQFPLVFTLRCQEDSSFWPWCLGMRSLLRGWDPSLLMGSSTTEIFLPILKSPHCGFGTCLICISTPPISPNVAYCIYPQLHKFCSANFSKRLIYLFIDRREGREKERERNINVWSPLAQSPPGS